MNKSWTNIRWTYPLYVSKGYRTSTINLVLLLYFLIGVSLVCIPLSYVFDYGIGVILMIYVLVVCVIQLLLFRYCPWPQLVFGHFGVQLILSTALLMLASGGMGSPYCISFFAIGPPAYVVLRDRDAHLWLLTVTLVFLLIATVQLLGYEIPYTMPDGLRPYVWAIIFICNSIMIVQAILTYRRRSYRYKNQIKANNDKLSQSKVELERFAHIASHDLTKPLRSIINFGQILDARYRESMDESSLQYLAIVRQSASEMERLVSDILAFSQARNHDVATSTVDLQTIVMDITQTIEAGGEYPHMQVIAEDLPVIESDATLIRQLFQNIIENGLKYNESDTPIVIVSHRSDDDMTHISIQDNGIGIDTEYFDKVFEMFQRLHNKETYQGTGIGLAICKKIAQTLGGSISISSSAGEGSTFVISIPTTIKKSPDGLARALDY